MDETAGLIGLKVRYPSTGTEGTIEQVAEIEGHLFVGLDSTHLFYRIDQVIPVEKFRERREGIRQSIDEILEKEDISSSDEIQEAFRRWDGECGG
ncbi:MAG: DUF2098 family protein [Methanomicrobiaceae archaeon]|nr:DUF2098 family protein [Methanomicrobiaceae archaeon]